MSPTILRFDHEGLDCYRLALEVARRFQSTRFPRGDAALKDQGLRAARSVVLNIAEGRSKEGRAGAHSYRVARGEAAEACAVLDLVALDGSDEMQAKLRRINQMLRAMGG